MVTLVLAIFACFLIWKLYSAINKEPTFLNSDSSNSTSISKKAIALRNVVIMPVQKTQKKGNQNEASTVFEEEKPNIAESLHNEYFALLVLNPQLRVSILKSYISEVYEELFACFQNKKAVFANFLVDPALCIALKSKIENLLHEVRLYKIDGVDIESVKVDGKNAEIIAKVTSKQLVYKEDESGKVVEGSKVIPVDVVESIECSLSQNSPLLQLKRIF